MKKPIIHRFLHKNELILVFSQFLVKNIISQLNKRFQSIYKLSKRKLYIYMMEYELDHILIKA